MSGLIAGASSTLKKRVQEFRASGTFTVPAGLKTVDLFMVGGGGGGRTSAIAGTGGNIVETSYDVNGKSTCAVVIGAGGAIGANGGDTSFDGVVIASGGKETGGVQAASSSVAPTNGKFGFGGNGYAGNFVTSNGGGVNVDALANTGGGGGINLKGGSGYARVEWYE